MEIKIFSLKLKNFKGIKDLEINFNCKDTNIYGANATGKTTIYDAFKWLFFDKDSSDRKDFNIKTLDADNRPIHFLEHEVEAILVIDGVDMTFKKVLQEKWVKKRGENDREFSGHETNYWIDEVPVKKKDYEEKINSLIPESLFKLITDPTYFNNQMSWKERRELLINISGANISDDEILNSKEEFKILIDNLEGRSIDDYKKVVQAKIKDLNKEKETIPIRIDELTNTLITEHDDIDYDILEKEKEMCNEELQNIETEMTNVQIRTQENTKKVDELAIAKNELNNLKFKLEVEHSDKCTKESINLNNEKTLIENKIINNDQLISNLNKNVQEIESLIEKDKSRKQELYKKWDEIEQTQLEIDTNEFVCPVCKREYEADKKEEIRQKFVNDFTEHKVNEKVSINKEGQTINIRIEENADKIESLYADINKAKQDNQELNKQLEEIKENIAKYEKQKSEEKIFDVNVIPEYQEKVRKVEQLQQIVDKLVSEDTSEYQNRKSKIVGQIDDINKKLNQKETQEKTKERIEELKSQEESISQKIQELEGQLYALEEFTKTKVELLENAINSKFELVKFRLFDTQINGGLVECCDTLVNGVPFADVNNAHKILAGLDIINTLIKFYNTSAPIFIDNRESINKIDYIDTQIISLIVTTDSTLRIEVI